MARAVVSAIASAVAPSWRMIRAIGQRRKQLRKHRGRPIDRRKGESTDEEPVHKRHPVDVPSVRQWAVEPNESRAVVQARPEEYAGERAPKRGSRRARSHLSFARARTAGIQCTALDDYFVAPLQQLPNCSSHNRSFYFERSLALDTSITVETS